MAADPCGSTRPTGGCTNSARGHCHQYGSTLRCICTPPNKGRYCDECDVGYTNTGDAALGCQPLECVNASRLPAQPLPNGEISGLPLLCNGMGRCEPQLSGGPGRCSCTRGWNGRYCEEDGCRHTQIDGYTVECNQHGVCTLDMPTHTYFCTCETSSFGTYCQTSLAVRVVTVVFGYVLVPLLLAVALAVGIYYIVRCRRSRKGQDSEGETDSSIESCVHSSATDIVSWGGPGQPGMDNLSTDDAVISESVSHDLRKFAFSSDVLSEDGRGVARRRLRAPKDTLASQASRETDSRTEGKISMMQAAGQIPQERTKSPKAGSVGKLGGRAWRPSRHTGYGARGRGSHADPPAASRESGVRASTISCVCPSGASPSLSHFDHTQSEDDPLGPGGLEMRSLGMRMPESLSGESSGERAISSVEDARRVKERGDGDAGVSKAAEVEVAPGPSPAGGSVAAEREDAGGGAGEEAAEAEREVPRD